MRFTSLLKGQERDKKVASKAAAVTGRGGSGSGFGRRQDRPDIELMHILESGANGASARIPRALRPPLVD